MKCTVIIHVQNHLILLVQKKSKSQDFPLHNKIIQPLKLSKKVEEGIYFAEFLVFLLMWGILLYENRMLLYDSMFFYTRHCIWEAFFRRESISNTG